MQIVKSQGGGSTPAESIDIKPTPFRVGFFIYDLQFYITYAIMILSSTQEDKDV